MATENKAAWIPAKGKQLAVGPADFPKPAAGEVIVQNHALAINPVDWMIQEHGFPGKRWPTILGNDLAGVVVGVGEGVADISKGQRVLGHAMGLLKGDAKYSAFQSYTVIPSNAVSPIPDDMAFEAAAVLPLCTSTAAAGLFGTNMLGLPFPSAIPKLTGKTVIIWAGSTSVGSCAIQLAVAAGFSVITTASAKNIDHCLKLGATKAFDYSSPVVVEDIVAGLGNAEVVGAYDAIGLMESEHKIAKILTKFGGGFIANVLEPPSDLPAGVTSKQAIAPFIFTEQKAVGKAIYQDFLPFALSSGQYKPAPQPNVVGHGLESLQKAMDTLRKGVSATKLVVTL
ncbi:MAG: hypothetical protein M1818_008431 [Claussenomyces sp. TS43310]|nr:MAG: hypothetical protein M1818_008431 [Claussenomyces sp. TS43310]